MPRAIWIIIVGATLLVLALALFRRERAHAEVPRPATHEARAREAEPHETTASAHAGGPRVTLVALGNTGLVWAPERCPPAGTPHDVLFHFHGVPEVVAENAERARLRAIIVVRNEGELADSYAAAWAAPAAFEQLLAEARRAAADHCGADPALGRIALSSFSAGFAAVRHLLRRQPVVDRVDAVLLEDSLYAAYADPDSELPADSDLEPFLEFARAAADGQKLMAITHSQVDTQGYASTVETADYLLEALGLERSPVAGGSGTGAELGNFWLRGLPGADAEAHARHLQRMGDTVLARLARRW